MITINLAKAKEITKDRLRIERKPLCDSVGKVLIICEAQDVLFMKAQEDGANTSAIVTEKNRLRDITKLADSADTTDKLKLLKAS